MIFVIGLSRPLSTGRVPIVKGSARPLVRPPQLRRTPGWLHCRYAPVTLCRYGDLLASALIKEESRRPDRRLFSACGPLLPDPDLSAAGNALPKADFVASRE